MLQYLVLLFVWSVSSLLHAPYCFNVLDWNFVALLFFCFMDTASQSQKAFRTLRAEYAIISGKNVTDVFLYAWTFMHLTKHVCIWASLSIIVHVSPIACCNSPLLACVLLLYVYFVKEYSNVIRKWWISTRYEKYTPVSPTEV